MCGCNKNIYRYPNNPSPHNVAALYNFYLRLEQRGQLSIYVNHSVFRPALGSLKFFEAAKKKKVLSALRYTVSPVVSTG